MIRKRGKRDFKLRDGSILRDVPCFIDEDGAVFNDVLIEGAIHLVSNKIVDEVTHVTEDINEDVLKILHECLENVRELKNKNNKIKIF
ncbi:MAG: hypothetical protein ACTSRA_00745 [Promethearchaeota archaeon]|nr:MAG: hypothetical protein [Helarchaeota virus Nidhogg Meg22_1012]URC17308.1 MAG: hypothetical protein [Helarchaeota virus Nidhogg Meg22_1214]